MATVQTAMTPREVLNRLYDRLRRAWGKFSGARPGDSQADAEILGYIEEMETLMQKLDYAFIMKVMQDAAVDAKSHVHLEKLHELMDEIVRGKRMSRRKEHVLMRHAKRMRRRLGAQARSARRTHQKEEKKLHTDIRRKKQEIGKRETQIKRLHEGVKQQEQKAQQMRKAS